MLSLNKLVAVKALAALAVVGFATGAAAGELPDPLQDLASDTAEIINVEIPDTDDDAADDDDAGDEGEDSGAEEGTDDSEDTEGTDEDAEGDEDADGTDVDADGTDVADDTDATEDEDADEPKAPKVAKNFGEFKNHGQMVSDCARNTNLTGEEKGAMISALARGVGECDLGEESNDEAPAVADTDESGESEGDEHKTDGQAKAAEKRAARDARKAAKQV